MGGSAKKSFSHFFPPSKFYQISNLKLLIIQILWFCQHTHANLGCGGLLDQTPSQRIKCEKVEEKNHFKKHAFIQYELNVILFHFRKIL